MAICMLVALYTIYIDRYDSYMYLNIIYIDDKLLMNETINFTKCSSNNCEQQQQK